jgi:hypothetical protein
LGYSRPQVTPDEVRRILLAKRTKRDEQRKVGPSEIGGCRRKVWHRIQHTPQTNLDTLRLAANLGTAIHSWIETQLANDDRFILETRVERDGLVGHVDCYDKEQQMVIDWKTIKLSGVPYFPSKQQRWQVHIYGWLMSLQHEVRSVCLVGLPRDGTDRDVITHTEPYSERIALEALTWLREIEAMPEPPKPEKPKKFCRDYCTYYDPTGVIGCTGA